MVRMESPQNYSDHHSCLRTISTHTTGPEPHSPPRLGRHLEQAHAFLQLSACALLTRLKSLPTDNHSWFSPPPQSSPGLLGDSLQALHVQESVNRAEWDLLLGLAAFVGRNSPYSLPVPGWVWCLLAVFELTKSQP